jgi:uncharacterized membrane protein YhiD involved in acid resistance
MKEDLLNLISTWGVLAEAATWIWIGSALFVTVTAAWVVVSIGRRIGRHVADSFTRANQTVSDAQTDLISAEELDAHLTATWQQLADETRKEEQS